ncbi:hypothetical protein HMPREF1624_05015 [Sporothrix schenckii ATCC 58251]|uniref:GAT domain-containing protein n=1 Tax=Sporothrix schenckii (strain ATCC 58251 / de Perez 2211183) TaxID=1391915 RepID=U7PRL0_SPOS1|nr:hypothetical protein HMPREF1624_05015 [Sporothrix schenckii ATCC 58251]
MKGFRQKLNRNRKSTFDVDTVAPQRTDSVTTAGSGNGANSGTGDNVDHESPEAAAQRLVRTFCMSEVDEAGAEVALLPSIVEAAESSPQAATECARYIRKFLHRDYWSRPNFVYNAIMLMRILVENPGMTFTRNMDKKFVDTVRDLLRGCQHAHIVHFLIETLQDFESKGAVDEGIGRIVEMWQKEKAKSKSAYSNQPPRQSQGGQGGLWHRPQQQMWPQQSQNYPGQGNFNYGQGGYVNQGGFVGPGHDSHNSRRGPYERGHTSAATLPKPRELRKRLDEAKTTASVLADVVNTTTQDGLLRHDLADDLSARCRRATNQVLEYMNTHDPIPDNYEMAALLSTHEVLEQTLHHYHRAVLEARKSLGVGESRRTSDGNEAFEMTPAGKGKANAPQSPVAGAPSGTNGSRSRSESHSNGLESPRSGDETFDRNEDDDMIAAAIAASTAPGANARGGRGGYQQGEGSSAAGPANETENPFADNLPESSRSSSRVRPVYGAGGGASSSAAAGAAGAAGGSGSGAVAYVDSENESDEEYLRVQRRNKALADVGSSSSSTAAGGSRGPRASGAGAAGSSSSSAAAAGAAAGASSSSSAAPPVPPASSKPAPASPRIRAPSPPTEFDAGVGGSSSSAGPVVDSEAGGSGGPVFRY